MPALRRNVHTVGAPELPDVILAKRVAERISAPIRHVVPEYPAATEVAEHMQAYCAETCATTPATTAIRMHAFDAMSNPSSLLLDGGFGEIARAQFLGRLRYAWRFPNPAKLAKKLVVTRADVFTPDVTAALWAGWEREVEQCFVQETVPYDDRHNKLDWIAIRTRLPNFYAYEQARLDGVVQNYMPFAQPSFLAAVLATPVRQRSHGRVFKQTIRKETPALAKLPLIKGSNHYPFWLPVFWASVAERIPILKRTSQQPTQHTLFRYPNLVGDMVHTSATRTCGWYDQSKLDTLFERFQQQDVRAARALDWWLSFEFWRQSLRHHA